MDNTIGYISIYPSTHITLSNNRIFLYNTLNGESLILHDINLYGIFKKYHDSYISTFYIPESFKHIIQLKSLGTILSKKLLGHLSLNSSKKKPIQIPQLLAVREDFSSLSHTKSVFTGKNFLRYITQATININNICKNNCVHCDSFYKQFQSCSSCKNSLELSIKDIRLILSQLSHSNIQELNITGGNICQYRNLQNLLTILNKSDFHLKYILHIDNILEFIENYSGYLNSSYEIQLNIPPDFDLSLLKTLLSQVENINIVFNFIIECENDLIKAYDTCNIHNIDNFNYIPFYNSENFDFFKNFSFIEHDELFEDVISLNEIRVNQTFNKNKFGHIYISSDGNLSFDSFTKKVGSIKSQLILDLITSNIEELKQNWMLTRKNVPPCSKCLFTDYCPPISSYEQIMNNYKICNFDQKKILEV